MTSLDQDIPPAWSTCQQVGNTGIAVLTTQTRWVSSPDRNLQHDIHYERCEIKPCRWKCTNKGFDLVDGIYYLHLGPVSLHSILPKSDFLDWKTLLMIINALRYGWSTEIRCFNHPRWNIMHKRRREGLDAMNTHRWTGCWMWMGLIVWILIQYDGTVTRVGFVNYESQINCG